MIFAQLNLLQAILKAAKERLFIPAIETTAFVEHEKFVDLIQYVDFICTDLKHYNSVNRKITGGKNELIVKNIHYAFTHQKTIVLRIPVIPDFNNSLEDGNSLQLFSMNYPSIKSNCYIPSIWRKQV